MGSSSEKNKIRFGGIFFSSIKLWITWLMMVVLPTLLGPLISSARPWVASACLIACVKASRLNIGIPGIENDFDFHHGLYSANACRRLCIPSASRYLAGFFAIF